MFIFSNLATSLDGKIATQKRSFFPLGTLEDLRQMQVLRKRCDAILMGASTMRVYKKPCTIDQLGDKLSSQPINILVSSKLKNLDPKWDFFTDTRIKRILFVGSSTAPAQIKKFSKSSEIIVLRKISKKYPLASQITEALKHRNISRILVEGGGEIMWDFASLGLIDEFHVTLTPKILGGAKAPTLVDGEGFEPEKTLQLKLRQCKIIGDEIYLTYARRN